MSTELQPINTGTGALVLSHESMKAMYDMAKMMASATVTVPKHLANSPGDCLAVVMQAMQWGMNPFAVAQKTHLVNGTLGYEAQLVNAVVSASGAAGRFHYEYRGEGANLACRVGAVIRGDDDITWGEWLSVSEVGTKNSPLWKTNPRQQLGYLQVKNWARAFTPGAILGVYTDDELMDQPVRRIEQVAEAQPVEYSQEEFDQKVGQWQSLVESGKYSANDLIAMVESKGKVFTMDQKMILASFEVPEATTEEVAQ